MNHKKTLAIAFFATLGLAAVHTPDLQASPRGRSATRTNATQQRTARTRAPRRSATAQSPNRATSPLKNVNHLAKVESHVKQWTKWTMEGKPSSNGNYDFHAAFADLVTAQGSHTVVRPANYGKHPQRIKVSGVKDGTWRGHLFGTVSVHDLVSLAPAPYAKAVKDRVAADRVQVSYDHGPNTPRVIAVKGVKSDVVTKVPLEIPLNPKKSGMTRVFYERTNASGGVVGGVSGYPEGRTIEIVQ